MCKKEKRSERNIKKVMISLCFCFRLSETQRKTVEEMEKHQRNTFYVAMVMTLK